MDLKNVIENFKRYDFPQRFFALVMLIQVSAFLISIVMRIFVEFGWYPLSLILYTALIVFGVVIMLAGIFALRGKTATYVSASLLYFGAAVLFAILLRGSFIDIFSIFAIGSSVFASFSSANLLISMIILAVALFRLLALGATKDYSRPPKPVVNEDSIAKDREELERLKRELEELKKERQQS